MYVEEKNRSWCSSSNANDHTTERRRDLFCEIAHPGIHPVAGTAFVCKPTMDSQDHLAGLRLIVQSLILIAEPQELRLAVARTIPGSGRIPSTELLPTAWSVSVLRRDLESGLKKHLQRHQRK